MVALACRGGNNVQRANGTPVSDPAGHERLSGAGAMTRAVSGELRVLRWVAPADFQQPGRRDSPWTSFMAIVTAFRVCYTQAVIRPGILFRQPA